MLDKIAGRYFYRRVTLLLICHTSLLAALIESSNELNTSQIVRAFITRNALLPCSSFKKFEEPIQTDWWHCGIPKRIIGTVDKFGKTEIKWSRGDAYDIVKSGNETFDTVQLLIKGARRELVDRYECVVFYADGGMRNSSINFRLDFSFWYNFRWNSLFFGSCLAALVFCVASFILNIIWIGCRKTMLWWINRAERMSRVRSMVEAMEKYRQRQMESLHDTYHRRVTNIRDNYHQQVEQLRASYGNQAGRFRGYRQARMDNVTQHLDNIRDNYNQQLQKIREYGSRRTEQLWENYERQLNRMRMFTLEQRLKLMRQYKVKQRYINKLLESFADSSNPEDIQKRESEIRAALNLPIDTSLVFPHATISRASSYYSLPEFVIEDERFQPIPNHYNGPSSRDKQPFISADMPSTSRADNEIKMINLKSDQVQYSCNPHPRNPNLATVRVVDGRRFSSDASCLNYDEELMTRWDGSTKRTNQSLYPNLTRDYNSSILRGISLGNFNEDSGEIDGGYVRQRNTIKDGGSEKNHIDENVAKESHTESVDLKNGETSKLLERKPVEENQQ